VSLNEVAKRYHHWASPLEMTEKLMESGKKGKEKEPFMSMEGRAITPTVLVHPEIASLFEGRFPRLRPVVTEAVPADQDGEPVAWVQADGGDYWLTEVAEGGRRE